MPNLKTIVSSCIGDKDISNHAQVIYNEFYTAARTAIDPHDLFTTPHGALLRNKSTIVYSEASRTSMNALIGRVEKLLPPAFANRRALQTTLPDIIATLIEDGVEFKEFKPRLKDFLERILSQAYNIFLPNNLFVLNGVSSLSVGPVSILSLSEVEKSVNEVAQNIQTVDPNAGNFTAKTTSGRLSVNYNNTVDIITPSSHTMWRVNVEAHPEQAREEALWRIRVASGLIGYLGKTWSGPKPYGTRLERHPTIKNHFMGDTLLRMTDTNVTLGGGSVYPPYEITALLKSEIESADSKKVIDSIMLANPKTVGERIYLALGWISVARASDERPQHLLASMTALEAIFSRGKDAPVSETIARLGSVIVATSINDRQAVAKMIKSVYNVRSKVVHNGRREITETEANTALSIVQYVVDRIINVVDLNMKSDTFIDQLVKASYGDTWPITP